MGHDFPSFRTPYGVARRLRNATICALLLALPAAAAEPVVIAALGDSLTQGYGLPADDGFVPQLSDWLAGEGAEVRIVNAGVSGDTTAGGLSRVEWTLTPDVGALIVALGGNDVLRGIDPAVARANLSGILKVARARDLPVLLVGIDAPGNYGADYETAFEAIYPDLATEFDTLLYPDFLGAILSLPDQAAALGALMQGDGIHPNGAGVARIVEDMGPSVLDLARRARD